MGLFNVKKGQRLRPVVPPFLATGTSSVEDNFSTVLVRADGFCFTHPSPPAQILTGHRWQPVHGPGLGTPALEALVNYSPIAIVPRPQR